jgi:hypothetical protein
MFYVPSVCAAVKGAPYEVVLSLLDLEVFSQRLDPGSIGGPPLRLEACVHAPPASHTLCLPGFLGQTFALLMLTA